MTYADVVKSVKAAAVNPYSDHGSFRESQSRLMFRICSDSLSRDYVSQAGLYATFTRAVVAFRLLMEKGISADEIAAGLQQPWFHACSARRAHDRYRAFLRGASGCYNTDQELQGELMLRLEAAEAIKLYVDELSLREEKRQ